MKGEVVDRCVSTNDLARKLGEEGAPHGTWISARVQEKGRGRLGRQWNSLEGNLFLSMVARIEDKSRWTLVPLATAVAITRVLRSKWPELDLRIKWPNDLWLDGGAKLGGILCEAVGNRDGSFIVIGVGLNCSHAPEGLDQRTASLSASLARSVSADDVRAEIVDALHRVLKELIASGVSAVITDYERWAALAPGTQIEWSQKEGLVQVGEVLGLGSLGELRVRSQGKEMKLYAEDVKVRPRARS